MSRSKLLAVLAIGIGMVFSGCGGGGSSSKTVIPVGVSTTTLPAATVNAPYSQQLAATGGSGSCTWTLTTAVAGFSLSSSGLLTGTPTSTTSLSFQVKAADSTDSSNFGTSTLTLTVNPAPVSISTTTLPAATVNAPYSQQLAATGGSGSYTWTLTTAVAGFSLSSSGLLTGTPTSTTSLSFQVKATDSANSSNFGTSTLILAVSPGTLLITTTALPNGLINGAYSFTLQSTGGVAPFTWSLTAGTSLPPGLNLDGPTGAITGTPTTTGVFSATFRVMDSGSPQQTNTKTLSLTIPQLSITTNSLLNPMVGKSYNQTLHYTDVNGTLPLIWSVSSGTLPTSLSLDPSTGAITGTPTQAGSSNFTVQLVDSSTPAQTATQALTLTVTPSGACETGSETLLSGQYAMSLMGFDGSGPAGMLASFTADGAGNITAGVEDINSVGGVQTNVSITPAGSSYSIGPDRRGCLTLVTASGTRVFRIAVGIINNQGVATSGRSIEFDTTGTNTTGSFQIQVGPFTNAAMAGTYTFTADSPLAMAGGGFFGAVGTLTLNSTGTTVSGLGDININGNVDPGNAGYPATPMTFTAGSYNIGANGRGTLSFTIPTTPAATTINAIVYVLNSTQMDLMNSDAQSATSTLFSGFAGKQTGAPYANSSLSQPSVLFSIGQTSTGNAMSVTAGIFTPDGSGNLAFAGDQNMGGTTSTVTETGTYTVAANGRALVTKTGDASPSLVMYMVLPNWAYALSTDTHVMIGFAEPQSGEPFTNASLSGTFSFGTIIPVVAASPLTAGETTYDGNGNVTLTYDVNENGFLSIGNVASGTYAVSSNGRVVTPASGITRRVNYIKDSGTVVGFGYIPMDTNPFLLVMDQ